MPCRHLYIKWISVMPTPMEPDPSVANKAQKQSTCPVLVNSALLGFHHVVAPFGKNACSKKPNNFGTSLPRNVCQLPGTGNATPKVAPPLNFVIRKILEGKQMSDQAIKNYLMSLGQLTRYQNAFNLFWGQCSPLDAQAFPPERSWNEINAFQPLQHVSLTFLSEQLILLHQKSASQARCAYSALLLIPGLEHLRFQVLLRPYKRIWNSSTPKYPVFWDLAPILHKFEHQTFDWKSPSQLRERVILAFRFFGLYRSTDLANMYRQVSIIGNKPFIWVKRKGWPAPRWD